MIWIAKRFWRKPKAKVRNRICPTAKLALILCIALDKTFEELFYF